MAVRTSKSLHHHLDDLLTRGQEIAPLDSSSSSSSSNLSYSSSSNLSYSNSSSSSSLSCSLFLFRTPSFHSSRCSMLALRRLAPPCGPLSLAPFHPSALLWMSRLQQQLLLLLLLPRHHQHRSRLTVGLQPLLALAAPVEGAALPAHGH